MAEKNSKFMTPSLFHFIQILEYYRQNFRNWWYHRIFENLIIGLVFNPAARVSADEEFSSFIINENDERKGHWDEPPGPLQWVHSEHSVGTWAVGQKGGQTSLFEKTCDENLVLHTLLEDRETTRLANENISPELQLSKCLKKWIFSIWLMYKKYEDILN